MEQRVPHTTMALEGPCAPMAKKKYPVVLPYVKGVSKQLRRVFRSFDIPAYFKLTNTLWQLLVQPKDKVNKGKVVGSVYHISCDDCDVVPLLKSAGSTKLSQKVSQWILALWHLYFNPFTAKYLNVYVVLSAEYLNK